MQVLGLFAALAFVLDAAAVAMCSILERYSSNISLLAFLGFFMLNFVIAWKVALWITERYLISNEQKQANDEHTRWVTSLFPASARR